MKIFHIFPNEKFTVDYITRINQLFSNEEHDFYIHFNRTKICTANDLPFDNVFWGEPEEDRVRFENLFKDQTELCCTACFLGAMVP